MDRAPVKQVIVRVGDKAWHCKRATVCLDDAIDADERNTPSICMEFLQVNGDADPVDVLLVFHRHIAKDADELGYPFMETGRPWSHAYGGVVDLPMASAGFPLKNRPFVLTPEDRLRVEVARWLARAGGLFADTSIQPDESPKSSSALLAAMSAPRDECLDVMFTLARFDVAVQRVYETADGQLVSMDAVQNRQANARRLAEPSRAQKAAPTSQRDDDGDASEPVTSGLDELSNMLGAVARMARDPLCRSVCESLESAFTCLADGDEPEIVIRALGTCLGDHLAAANSRPQNGAHRPPPTNQTH